MIAREVLHLSFKPLLKPTKKMARHPSSTAVAHPDRVRRATAAPKGWQQKSKPAHFNLERADVIDWWCNAKNDAGI